MTATWDDIQVSQNHQHSPPKAASRRGLATSLAVALRTLFAPESIAGGTSCYRPRLLAPALLLLPRLSAALVTVLIGCCRSCRAAIATGGSSGTSTLYFAEPGLSEVSFGEEILNFLKEKSKPTLPQLNAFIAGKVSTYCPGTSSPAGFPRTSRAPETARGLGRTEVSEGRGREAEGSKSCSGG